MYDCRMQGIASLKDGRIRASFPYDRHLVEQIKSMPGSRFHEEKLGKYWTLPLTAQGTEKLAQLGFRISGRLASVALASTDSPLLIPGLQKSLFPFQEQGVRFIEQRDGLALIADEQGLGKTMTALAYLQKHPELRPAVIVCPASLKLNWEKEAQAWMETPKVEVLHGRRPYKTAGEILVINYDILYDWVDSLIAAKTKVVIADEAHLCRSTSAWRTKALRKLVRAIRPRRFVALTGTPVVNRPMEYYSTLNLLSPSLFESKWSFAQRYCGAQYNGFGWQFNGASNTVELHSLLTKGGPMLRRLKSQVLPELPPKIRAAVPMEVSKAGYAEYCLARDQFKTWLKSKGGPDAVARASGAEALVKIGVLKQLAAKAKLESCISWIQDFLDSGNKLIVFAVHREILSGLEAKFPGVCVRVDGSTPQNLRQKAVEKFQTDKNTTLFLGNIQAAGVGLTLTASSAVAFIELPWTPGELLQAEDRAHRIGQEDCVNIYYLLAKDTIDQMLARMLDLKQGVVDSVTDGGSVSPIRLAAILKEVAT